MVEGTYIYCLIGKAEKTDLGLNGLNGATLGLIPYKDINAVVSEMPVINFDRFDKEILDHYVAIHQQVNEELMSAKGGSASDGKYYDVVPMAFGIIAPNIVEVSRIMERAYLQFKAALKKIKGKAEFVVQVWWDQKKLLSDLVRTTPEIQELKEELLTKDKILGLPLKLKLGKLIQQKAEVWREACLKDIQATLSSCSHDFTLNKLMGEEMIANFSFLVEKTRESELDRKMQELGRKYEGRLRFKYIGPMPPYSFVNINLSLGNFELVNEARELLGLSEVASWDEIKKAYYILAHQYHPDKQQNDLRKTQGQMKRITQAYSILENYCQSCDELIGKNENPAEGPLRPCEDEASEARQRRQIYSFKEKDVKNSLIIK